MDDGAGTRGQTASPAVAAARRRARELFLDDRHLHGCAETAFIVLKEPFGLPDPEDGSAAMALNGGVAYSGATCGAITGASLALGLLAERRTTDHPAAKRAARLLTADVLHRFKEEFGTTICRGLIGADISTEEGHEAFLDRGVWRVVCMRQIEFVIELLATLAGQEEWTAALASVDPAASPPSRPPEG